MVFLLFLFCIVLNNNALAQIFPVKIPSDSLALSIDTLKNPATKGKSEKALQKNDPIDEIEYGSTDTSIFFFKKNQIELFGDAFIKYQDYDIKADYILFDFDKNEVLAQYGYEGFKGKNKPTFDYDGQEVTAKKLRYNFNTNKGIVFDAIVQRDQLFIHGATTKFVKGENDSLHLSDDVIYNRNALITSCNLEHPHWGIRASKLKLIPEQVAILGPARLELAGIPVPLFLPFAFAPLFDFNAASSGLIFPQDPFVMDNNLGLGMRGLGYYFALSDKMDLSLEGDFYTRGSWALRASSNYYKRYKHKGNFGIGFSRQLIETEGIIGKRKQDSYSFNLTHNQDSKAHPYRTIGGSLRFTVNDFDRRNVSDANAQINSTINSNFSYAYKLSSKVNFTSSITHSQNTLTRDITFSLPDIQLRVSRLSPFDNPTTSGAGDKWYEKIGLEYSTRFQNSFTTKDTLLFTANTLDLISPGITHDVGLSAAYNLFKYFSFNTGIDYDEWWYFKTARREYEITSDSTGNNVNIVGRLKNGFTPYRDINFNAGISTSLYNTISGGKGWFRGFRHTIRPSLNLTFSPATDRYLLFIDEELDPVNEVEFTEYSPFQSQLGTKLFRSAPTLDNGGLRLVYNIQNLFEAKIYSKRDSIEKKIKLIDRLNISGDYNFNADSLNWSRLTFSGSVRLFNNITTISFRGQLDPYREINNKRVNRLVWTRQDGESSVRLPFRFEEFTLNISSQMTLQELSNLFKNEEKARIAKKEKRKKGEDELFSWFSSFRLSHTFRYRIDQVNGVNEGKVQTHSITLNSGRIPLTEKWGFGINNLSYDFIRKNFPIPQFSVFRDLHCWEMNFTWSPTSDIFTFSIGVKASPFSQYIKYQTGNQVFGGRSFR
ncbi:MAG: putative LPS assembly protein LptD [Saprospiraceae bacterium]